MVRVARGDEGGGEERVNCPGFFCYFIQFGSICS